MTVETLSWRGMRNKHSSQRKSAASSLTLSPVGFSPVLSFLALSSERATRLPQARSGRVPGTKPVKPHTWCPTQRGLCDQVPLRDRNRL